MLYFTPTPFCIYRNVCTVLSFTGQYIWGKNSLPLNYSWVYFLKNTKTPNLTFLGVKLGACFAICWFSVFIAERQGFEPTTLTAYISATLLSKFQIGNETVTIFRCWACPTLTAVCLPNFRVQRYCFLLKLANIW